MQGTLPQAHQPGPDTQHKILLVDDDAVSLEILTLMLGFDGHEVLRAADGESALAFLARPDATNAPDVLLVDMQMPGISGHELVRRVRAMEGPRPLLLGMSATALSTQQLLGFDGFLLKPLDLNDLRAALEPSMAISNGNGKPGNGPHAEPPSKAIKTPAREPGRNLSAEQCASGPSPRASRRRLRHESGPELRPDQPLNSAVLNKLRTAMPLESLKELYAACLADSRSRAKALHSLAREGRMAEIPREAHQIKGAASMVGADRIASLATTLELGSCKKEDTLLLLDDLLNACEQLERILLAGKLDQSYDDNDN